MLRILLEPLKKQAGTTLSLFDTNLDNLSETDWTRVFDQQQVRQMQIQPEANFPKPFYSKKISANLLFGKIWFLTAYQEEF